MSSALSVVQQNNKTMAYALVHSGCLMTSFVLVYHSDPDASSFMSPRMGRPGHWTQWSRRQHAEIVRMDAARVRSENERVTRLHRESQGLAACLAELRDAGLWPPLPLEWREQTPETCSLVLVA